MTETIILSWRTFLTETKSQKERTDPIEIGFLEILTIKHLEFQ